MSVKTRRKGKRRIYGNWKDYPRDYQRQDIRCPFCHGLGETADPPANPFKDVCIACAGTGQRSDFTARMLYGVIALKDGREPYEVGEDPEDVPW